MALDRRAASMALCERLSSGGRRTEGFGQSL
eukprot:CAMPEP_0181440274 /NCGR_PEP_ID=MMETSP1110-20121109/22882_1 /TAXON_ID=174948 /ORGANISM="Symbiodinium sp., Strain CCMP421" /LENGTH=30 /DNA_ID= /DNA_START= /DNA_END= /DNA_ORIENTATION=